MPLPCGIVTEKVVYGQNSTPWEIFDDQKDPWIQSKCKNKKTVYVFTKLKKKSKGKKQMERTAGCGTWDGQTAPRIIKNGHGKIIGSRKYFSFESRKYGNDYIKNYGHWGMHEFSVSDGGDYVLCAITRDDSKRIVKEVDVVQMTNCEEQSVSRLPSEELEVGSEFDPKLLKEDTAPLQVQNEVLDQHNAFGNSSVSQGSTMIEYEGFGNPGEFQSGSTMIDYNDFENRDEFQGSTMIGYEGFGNIPGEFQAGSTMIDYNGFENLGEIQGSTILTENDGFENPGEFHEYNGFENLGEFQGPTMMDYGQLGDFTANNLQNHGEGYWDNNIFDSSFLDAMPISMDDDIFDFSFLDGISLDEVPEPLMWENQVSGKRKFLEEAENPCGKKLCGTHM